MIYHIDSEWIFKQVLMMVAIMISMYFCWWLPKHWVRNRKTKKWLDLIWMGGTWCIGALLASGLFGSHAYDIFIVAAIFSLPLLYLSTMLEYSPFEKEKKN